MGSDCTSKEEFAMKNRRMAIWMTAGALLLAAPAFSQSEKPGVPSDRSSSLGWKSMGQGRAVVTILSKQHGEIARKRLPTGREHQGERERVHRYQLGAAAWAGRPGWSW
jgi:hypothetical protein